MFRANWHDYEEGIYFVTICSKDKKHIFGYISNNEMYLNEIGHLADNCVKSIPKHFPCTEVANHVIMPNHIHIVIAVGTRYIASTPKEVADKSKNLGCLKPPQHREGAPDHHHNSGLAVIVGTMKAAVTRYARTRCIASLPIWQSRFYEHIIRDQHSFDYIMNYVDENVLRWDSDCFNQSTK